MNKPVPFGLVFAATASFLSHAILAQHPAIAEASVSRNFLRNASFELSDTFNGSRMRQGTEKALGSLAKEGERRPLPIEGWWQRKYGSEEKLSASFNRVGQAGNDGQFPAGITLEQTGARSGASSLVLTGTPDQKLSIFSAPEVPVPAGPVTLSAWVRTENASGKLEIGFVRAGLTPNDVPEAFAKMDIALPPNAPEWTRVVLTTDAPADATAVIGITVDSGRVQIDDVQLEKGDAATEFDVRPEETLRLAFQDIPGDELPFWKHSEPEPRLLRIRNESRISPLKGTLEIWGGPWSNPKGERLAVLENLEIAKGEEDVIPLTLSHLPPDAYVVVPVLKQGGSVVFDGTQSVDPKPMIGGGASPAMLTSRSAIRFAISPNLQPAKIFGVGNGLLSKGWKGNDGDWYGGWPLAQFALAKPEGFTCGMGQYVMPDQAYLFAAAGIPFHRVANPTLLAGAPPGASFQAIEAGSVDFWNPDGMAFLKDTAEKIGKENAKNPQIASHHIGGEMFFAFQDGLCPTAAADAHFRAWCKERHRTLEALNERWGTAYTSWEEVEQPASVSYFEELKARPRPEGAAAIDWKATLGNITPEIHARMTALPGRAMDWFHWRTASSLWMYESFLDAAKKFDTKTLYSTNLPWPNFWPQMSMPFYRKMDAVMLDFQYTSGLPRSLGTPQEMMEIMESAESNAKGKPIWGIEVYTQPQFPGEFTALQNWGVLAHGITNNLVFAWGPYSDHGALTETRAWEKPNANPMWFMIDLDGTKLPSYHTNKRSLEEIRKFHETYDGLSLKRVLTDIAFFVSKDTAEYISFETASKPWSSLWTRTRNNLSYLLRMNGITADFVDDETLPSAPDRFQTIIVPASVSLNQESAGKLADFARAGGTVILAGPSGMLDPWTKPYANLGGKAWAELDWKAPDFQVKDAKVDFLGDQKVGKPLKSVEAKVVKGEEQPIPIIDETRVFKSAGVAPLPGATELKDAAGKVVGWTRPWGKGRLIAYSIIPDTYTSNPHPAKNLTAWIRQLIETGGLHHTGRWNTETIPSTEGVHGEGAPVVEVVTRVKEGGDKFVFALNQGGGGKGTVEVPVGEGKWQVTDTLTGQPIGNATVAQGILSIPLTVRPWEYRVFRLLPQ